MKSDQSTPTAVTRPGSPDRAPSRADLWIPSIGYGHTPKCTPIAPGLARRRPGSDRDRRRCCTPGSPPRRQRQRLEPTLPEAALALIFPIGLACDRLAQASHEPRQTGKPLTKEFRHPQNRRIQNSDTHKLVEFRGIQTPISPGNSDTHTPHILVVREFRHPQTRRIQGNSDTHTPRGIQTPILPTYSSFGEFRRNSDTHTPHTPHILVVRREFGHPYSPGNSRHPYSPHTRRSGNSEEFRHPYSPYSPHTRRSERWNSEEFRHPSPHTRRSERLTAHPLSEPHGGLRSTVSRRRSRLRDRLT